jgi:glutathione S-transferase
MYLVDIVALVALLQFFAFAGLVGRARGKYGVKAPAVTGHEMFERAYRVQMNTLEVLVLFIPALYIASRYWPPGYLAACGAVYVLGRIVYQRAYMSAPAKRGLGFALSIAPCLVLLIAGLFGAVLAAVSSRT